MAYIECDLDHKVPSIYDTLDIESKNTLDMTYIKGYSFPVYLGADTKLVRIAPGEEFWFTGANSYIKEALRIVQ